MGVSMNCWNVASRGLIAILLILVPASCARGAEDDVREDQRVVRVPATLEGDVLLLPMSECGASYPLCGVYCMVGAGASLGKELPLGSMLSGPYFEPQGGMTAPNLVQMAQDHGLRSRAFFGLDRTALGALDCPAILQFNRQTDGDVQHWVLFLGISPGGKVCIADPPNPVREYTPSEFDVLWNGVGVAVWDDDHNSPALRKQILGSSLRKLVWLIVPVALVGLATLIDQLSGRSQNRICKLISQSRAGMVAQVVLLVAGVFAWSGALMIVDSTRKEKSQILETLSCFGQANNGANERRPDYVRTISEGDTIIDCRLPVDYKAGHIPGAVNLPVGSDFVTWRSITASLPSDAKVVLYCQSVDCQWGAIAASRFHCFGIDAKVYAGGFERYRRERARRGATLATGSENGDAKKEEGR